MKHVWISYFVTTILTGVLVGLFFHFLSTQKTITPNDLISPLPDFLTKTKNDQVSTIALFLPQIIDVLASDNIDSKIQAKSAVTYDLTTNQTLFSKNPNTRLPMASITKVMTAVIALENKKSNNQYLVKSEDLVGENSMGLTAGEVLSLKELLYGLMLPSGNDAAEVFASNYPGGRTKFIEAMNKKAASLGLKNTQFTNPSGLQGDGDQYTTAHDLIVITKYALTFKDFTDVVQTFEVEIPATETHKYFYLQNETNLISSYPGVKGVKTGFTPEAGLCLVTYLDYKGHKIIGVLLGSENRRQEMKDLLDYSLTSLGVEPPEHE